MDRREFVELMDLPNLATSSAGELDNLIRGRSIELLAFRRLANVLEESIRPFESDPMTCDLTIAQVVWHALEDSQVTDSSLSMVGELKAETLKVITSFREICDEPARLREARADELKLFRSFCVVLSRRLASCGMYGVRRMALAA